jgi:RHS repeat-associated protein
MDDSSCTEIAIECELATVAYNLRFPGQVFDGQAGLHQNGFRDYDPAEGRYVESDPIGLMGGLNPYSYVRAGPMSLADPAGEDAIVVVDARRSDSWNILGHAWMAVTGGGLYSFGTGNDCGSSVRQFLSDQAQVRDQFVFQIHTSPAQDAQMLKYLRQFKQCKTVPKADNCAHRTEGALQAAGIPLTDPIFGEIEPLPASLLRGLLILQNAGQATSVEIPRGATPNIDVTQYEQRN